MSTSKQSKLVVLNKFNIYFQYIGAREQFLVLDAYSKIKAKRKKECK